MSNGKIATLCAAVVLQCVLALFCPALVSQVEAQTIFVVAEGEGPPEISDDLFEACIYYQYKNQEFVKGMKLCGEKYAAQPRNSNQVCIYGPLPLSNLLQEDRRKWAVWCGFEVNVTTPIEEE